MTELPDLMAIPTILIDTDPDEPTKFRITGGTYMHKDRIAQIPGSSFVGRGKDYWTVPRSWVSLKVLTRLFPSGLEWSQAALDWANQTWEGLIEPATRLRTVGADPAWIEAVGKMLPAGITLRDYQVSGAFYLATAKRGGLWDDQGTGKMTTTALTLSLYPDMYPALIICPKGVLWTWQRELAKFGIESMVVDGSAVERRKTFEEFDKSETCRVLIISYGLVAKHSRVNSFGTIKLSDEHKTPKELNATAWVTVVADEAHRIKDPTAVQTRACWACRDKATYVWTLTGTPIEQNIIEFWALLHFEDPVAWPAKTKFIDLWVLAVQNHFGGTDILGLQPAHAAEFHELTDMYWRRVLKSGLPPKVFDTRFCKMDAKSAKAYANMQKQLMAELDSDGTFETLFAANHMVKTGRLKMMASAPVMIDADDSVRMVEKSWKLDTVEEAMEDYEGKPIIFWFDNRDLLHLWEARLTKAEKPFVSVHGDVTGKDRDEAIQAFQRGDVDYILLTYGAGSEGTTLTRSPVAFRVQRPWSSIQDKQAPDRNHRIGSEHHDVITYVDFITLGTVEEDLVQRLEEKEAAAQEVLRDSRP